MKTYRDVPVLKFIGKTKVVVLLNGVPTVAHNGDYHKNLDFNKYIQPIDEMYHITAQPNTFADVTLNDASCNTVNSATAINIHMKV